MLIQIKCQNCGANIKVENNSKLFVCDHCGSEHVLEDVINNYQTVNQYHTTQNIVKNIYGKESMDVEDIIKNGDVFISLGEFGKAKRLYGQAVNINPADYRGWFGLVKVRTLNFTKVEDKSHLEFLEKAMKVANQEQQQVIESQYREFLVKVKNENQRKEVLKQEEELRKQELLNQQLIKNEQLMEKTKKAMKYFVIIFAISLVVTISLIILLVAVWNNYLDEQEYKKYSANNIVLSIETR